MKAVALNRIIKDNKARFIVFGIINRNDATVFVVTWHTHET